MNWQKQLELDPQILVVCTGNICRSPLGEVVLKKKLAQAGLEVRAVSAGVSAEEEGNPIHPLSARVLRENGYRVPLRNARKANAHLLHTSGLIIAMTKSHALWLREECEKTDVPISRIHLWREFSDGQIAPEGCFGPGGMLADASERGAGAAAREKTDVPDPWSHPYSAYVDTFTVIEAGAEKLVNALREAEN